MRHRMVEILTITTSPPPPVDEAVWAFAMAEWAVQSATETGLNGVLLDAHLQAARARGDLFRSVNALQRSR